MANHLSKGDLIVLVQRLIDADGSEAELDDLLALLSTNVPHPTVSDLIYYPSDPAISAERIVELALTYQAATLPIAGPARS